MFETETGEFVVEALTDEIGKLKRYIQRPHIVICKPMAASIYPIHFHGCPLHMQNVLFQPSTYWFQIFDLENHGKRRGYSKAIFKSARHAAEWLGEWFSSGVIHVAPDEDNPPPSSGYRIEDLTICTA